MLHFIKNNHFEYLEWLNKRSESKAKNSEMVTAYKEYTNLAHYSNFV